ncbi:MAG: NmrA family NAD(P)-binding protein, partial [Rhodothermales bacterium]|nr:NmrA family NAD(P)-binding protein [Rhodothermales bacterium]
MSHLILGGTGTVGGAVARELKARGESVTVMTRSAEKVADLPDGIDGVVADMVDPLTFDGAFDGHEGLFLLNPVSQTELQEGLFALEEAKRAGMRHIVYLSVHDLEKGPHLPHFASKIAIEDAIRKSGITYTILRPNNFFQNDFWWKDAIVGYGVYPQPLGNVGV